MTFLAARLFSAARIVGKTCISAGLAMTATMASAQGDLLIAPTRVVLNGSQGTEVILNNIGSAPATYRITLELRRMGVNGELDPVDPAVANVTEKAALDLIRYAPRRILLPPNQPQAVRISARLAPELPDGEYRAHMSFRAIPDAAPVTAPTEQQTSAGVSIKLIPIYGITIPIIVRKGQLQATAAISDPQVIRSGNEALFKVALSREGDRSVFGEIRVMAPGKSDPIFLARGIAVYPEITRREVILPISPEQAAKLHGPVRLEYRELPENGGKLIASMDANLG